jgi:hypothetical protein
MTWGTVTGGSQVCDDPALIIANSWDVFSGCDYRIYIDLNATCTNFVDCGGVPIPPAPDPPGFPAGCCLPVSSHVAPSSFSCPHCCNSYTVHYTDGSSATYTRNIFQCEIWTAGGIGTIHYDTGSGFWEIFRIDGLLIANSNVASLCPPTNASDWNLDVFGNPSIVASVVPSC